ncbi:hypothetical protein HWQ46_27075, partial [Shewanella sp. D64]
EDVNDDGYINSTELDGQINITITLDPITVVGETLVVTDQAGNELFSGTVTQEILDNGLLLSMNAPVTDTNITVTATLTNFMGAIVTGSDNALLDYGTGAPASPTVDITEDANDDGFINSAELDGQITITITLGAGTAVGDTLIVTDQDNNVIFSGSVTQEMIDNDLSLVMDAPAEGTNLIITAVITDAAGNTNQGSDSATLDTTAPGTGDGEN